MKSHDAKQKQSAAEPEAGALTSVAPFGQYEVPAAAPDAALAADAVGSSYQVTIAMSQATIQALQGSSYNLYGFKAVQATQGGGAPLVWFQMPPANFLPTTTVSWQEQYQAYISTVTQITPNTTITTSASVGIALGQTWNVQAGGGTNVTGGAGSGPAISILNTTGTQFTCGISQQQPNGSVTPLCAFPLYGNNEDVIVPIEQVLLMFSTTPVNTGTVIMQAYSSGILINLTANNQQSVNYDINAGWSWGGGSWAQSVPPQANLVPLLIQSPSDALKRHLRARN